MRGLGGRMPQIRFFPGLGQYLDISSVVRTAQADVGQQHDSKTWLLHTQSALLYLRSLDFEIIEFASLELMPLQSALQQHFHEETYQERL